MHRFVAACAAGCALLVSAAPAEAQAWNDERTMTLVRRATERRAQQLADTGLTDYAATARGYLTFLAQMGEGFAEPPKIVKADELALEVYWRAPNQSKQWILGRRDTLLLPTDIQYHRDHLGIVQNNFPNIIRLGDGDEVRDVPHPLSLVGLSAYDYRVSDSLRIEIPGRVIDVYEVKLRPRDGRSAAAVGAVYLARDDAQVVRMAFSFTRAALIDAQLEDVSIVLDNSLVETRFWLPRRQEIEIRRSGTWMDFPVRGIIRGRWEICCYQVNQGAPPAVSFVGPEIVPAPPAKRNAHRFEGTILDLLPPDVREATDEDVRRVQDEARALVRAAALRRARSATISARRASDLVRIDRVQGLSLGIGARQRLGAGFDLAGDGRFGFADHEPKGGLSLGWERAGALLVRLEGFRRHREAGDVQETSVLRNSVAAQEFGADYTEPFDTRGVLLQASWGLLSRWRWRAEAGYEWHDSVSVLASPAHGRYEPTIPALPGEGPRASVRLEASSAPGPEGVGLRTRFDADVIQLTPRDDSLPRTTTGRLFGSLEVRRRVGTGTLLVHTTAAVVVGGTPPPQTYAFAGGPSSARGYGFHELAAKHVATQHVEWQMPVPFPSLPLGRWGSTPTRATLVPFAGVAYANRLAPFRLHDKGWFPSVGVGLVTLFDLLRIDVARGLRGGRWTLQIDVTRDFWSVL
jgi:hypothetical protein